MINLANMYTLPYVQANTCTHSHSASTLNQHQPIPRQHTPAAANIRITQETETLPLNGYKIPSLYKRFMAESFDCIYIQLVKIMIVIALLNYTDLM